METLKAGDVAIGHMISEFWTRGTARIAAAAGFDFLIFDMEHTGASISDLADQVAWMRATPLTMIVRPPGAEYEYIARAFDLGVDGVMVPRVETAAEARDVVSYSMYPPIGRRGLATGVGHDDYRADDLAATVARANENAIVVIQIETRSALEQIDEITTVPRVAIAWFGPHDFASECGLTGEAGAKVLDEAAATIAASCERAGIVAGIQPGTVDEAARFLELGFRCISFGKDSAVYLDACRAGVDALRRR